MYKAIFYDDPKNRKHPAKEFLEGLDVESRGKFWNTIELLEATGRVPRPYAAHLDGPIWELRFRTGRNRYRVLYAIVVGRKIVLLLGFTKTTARVPVKYITKAKTYLEEYLSRL